MVVVLDTLTTPNPYAAGYPGQRKVAVRSTDGRIFATWDSDNGSVIAYSDDKGNSWSEPELVKPGFEGVREASLWADGVGNVYIIYVWAPANVYRIQTRTILPDNTITDSVSFVGNTYVLSRPVICSLSDGSVAFAAWRRGTTAINYTIRTDGVWSAVSLGPTIVNASYPQQCISVYPVHPTYGNPTINVTWCSTSSTSENTIFLKQYDCTTGVFGDNYEFLEYSPVGDAIGWPTHDTMYQVCVINGNAWTFNNGSHSPPYLVPLSESGLCSVAVMSIYGNNFYAVVVDDNVLCRKTHNTEVTFDTVVIDDSLTSITSLSSAPYHPYAIYYDGDNNTIRFANYGTPWVAVKRVPTGVEVSFGDR